MITQPTLWNARFSNLSSFSIKELCKLSKINTPNLNNNSPNPNNLHYKSIAESPLQVYPSYASVISGSRNNNSILNSSIQLVLYKLLSDLISIISLSSHC